MSTYKKITKHPTSGVYEKATWHDDYFAPHVYGVEFSDGKVYPVEMVEKAQIHDFWADDVVEAFLWFLYGNDAEWTEEVDEDELKFLNLIQECYARRWREDPITGYGATDKSVVVRRNKKD